MPCDFRRSHVREKAWQQSKGRGSSIHACCAAHLMAPHPIPSHPISPHPVPTQDAAYMHGAGGVNLSIVHIAQQQSCARLHAQFYAWSIALVSDEVELLPLVSVFG